MLSLDSMNLWSTKSCFWCPTSNVPASTCQAQRPLAARTTTKRIACFVIENLLGVPWSTVYYGAQPTVASTAAIQSNVSKPNQTDCAVGLDAGRMGTPARRSSKRPSYSPANRGLAK